MQWESAPAIALVFSYTGSQPFNSGGGHQVFRAAGEAQDGANLRIDPEAKNLGPRALARRLFAVQGHGRDHANDTHRNGGRPRLSDS